MSNVYDSTTMSPSLYLDVSWQWFVSVLPRRSMPLQCKVADASRLRNSTSVEFNMVQVPK